jgi:cytochrome P450
MVRLPLWLWHPGKSEMARSAADQRAAVARLIARRRMEAAPREDILARLLKARHPDTGEPMADDLLIDNLATFLAAGHETTGKALTWTLYILARAPEWQERVRREIAAVAGNGPLAPDHIAKLELTQRVLKEAMRLYPPAPVLSRITTDWTTFGNHRVAPGTFIIIPVYAVHRHLKLWQDPDRFDPDRFLPEREATYSRMQYMPFGFGQRSCIGSAFAMIEATALLTELIRGANFAWDGKHEPEPVSRVTLRPKGGMPLIVEALR